MHLMSEEQLRQQVQYIQELRTSSQALQAELDAVAQEGREEVNSIWWVLAMFICFLIAIFAYLLKIDIAIHEF